ncbi:branched-chain amino acid ABC transporter permease [Mariniplasma anaerobium]|uniref:Branched-chain amino acid ABC transporter permease n=1 Tax=Mariniplasma anaerobium TaxID=2735436 RepID=A0A7U9TIF8_9MOLU|nr:branched-chain amino acid ABC transporter permease [Mariniplasma anaerobium]BCR36015.1 branched-chain amino acid ABC transporter permease [Mariniplasma anaerobium]
MRRIYREKLKPFFKNPKFGFLVFGLILIVLRFLSGVIPPDLFGAIVTTSYFYLAGLGFALLLGYGGLASLGTGAFVGIGAFSLHYLYRFMTLPLTVSIVGAILISITVSLLFGFVSLRIAGMYLAIVTMGLSQIVVEIIKNIPEYASGTSGGFLSGAVRRPLAFLGIQFDSNSTLFFIAVFVVIGMSVVYNLINSPTGRALLSMKNSETAAQTMGISLIKYRLFAFTISGVFGTLAGILSLMFVRNADVTSVGLAFALNILAAVVIGGTKSIWGILLGTFVIFGLNLAVLQPLNLGSYSIIINGLLIIIVVMFYPGGLIQLFGDIKRLFIKTRLKLKERVYGTEE